YRPDGGSERRAVVAQAVFKRRPARGGRSRAMRLTFPSNDWNWTMSTITEKAKEEFLLILTPTAFFFVALHIVALIRWLMSKGEGIPISSTVSIAVAALILGKAVVLASMLRLINRYPDRPLGFNVAWKTLIYLIASGLIHYVERLIDAMRKAGGLIA